MWCFKPSWVLPESLGCTSIKLRQFCEAPSSLSKREKWSMLCPERFPGSGQRFSAVMPDLMLVHFSRPELDPWSSSTSYSNFLPGEGLKRFKNRMKSRGKSSKGIANCCVLGKQQPNAIALWRGISKIPHGGRAKPLGVGFCLVPTC